MSRRDKFFDEHNAFGQRKRPKYLSDSETEVVVNTINSARNDPRYTEVRVYWSEDRQTIWAKPVAIGKGNKVSDD